MMPSQLEAEKNRSPGMLKAGVTVVDVSRTLNCSRIKIHELAGRFRETDNMRDHPRSGRPRESSQFPDHAIFVAGLDGQP